MRRGRETDIEATLDDVPGLVVRQMDATAAFARLRDTYQSRIDALFDTLVARGVDIEHDRAIVRDLLALAPPGVDELFALSTLGDAIAERTLRAASSSTPRQRDICCDCSRCRRSRSIGPIASCA